MIRPGLGVYGRGGRVIVVDERLAAPLNEVLNTLPHPRERNATQPMDVVEEAQSSVWSDRFLDAVSHYGLWVLAGVVVVCLIVLLIVGSLR